jgi:hypothetical protein
MVTIRKLSAVACILVWVLIGGLVPSVQAADPVRRRTETGNDDDYADLVVGVPGEDWSSTTDAGVVHVLYADGSGIPTQSGDLWRQGSGGLPGTMEMWDAFGTALAAGDFNGDGYTDLVIGATGESVDGSANAGVVQVLYAAPDGLTSAGNAVITQDDLYAQAEPNDAFGQVLAVGDFNRDGYADLAVGVPLEDVYVHPDDVIDAGSVNVLYGSAAGLSTDYNQSFSEHTLGTDYKTSDQFGAALAACDFDGDGYDDLAIGVPGEDFGYDDIGAVQIVFGSAGRLIVDDSQVLVQGMNGLDNAAEAGDHFGRSLAAGYFDGDAYCDLAVGVTGEEPGTFYTDSGAVHVLYASASGFALPDRDWVWSRYDTDVAGEIQDEAFFGRVLASGDFNGDGIDDLAIGTPYDDVNGHADAGSVHVMFGGATNGLSDWDDRVWYQGGYINTAVETNDRFGWSLATGDVDDDGYDDLVIGTPYEHIGTVGDAGMVQVFYGAAAGIPAQPRYQNLHQDTDMIQNTVEADDRFGAAVVVLRAAPRRVYLPLVTKGL